MPHSPRLDHIFTWVGPIPPAPPSLLGLLAWVVKETWEGWDPPKIKL